jgi:hypothetical protein
MNILGTFGVKNTRSGANSEIFLGKEGFEIFCVDSKNLGEGFGYFS